MSNTMKIWIVMHCNLCNTGCWRAWPVTVEPNMVTLRAASADNFDPTCEYYEILGPWEVSPGSDFVRTIA